MRNLTISNLYTLNIINGLNFSQISNFVLSTLNISLSANNFSFRSARSSLTCTVIFIIQRLSSHYNLTSFSNNSLFLRLINITSQRRNQQRCQNCQNNQNHDQLYQRKPPFLLRRFCCSAIIFSIMILFLQFHFCFSISVSCGGAPQSYTYYIAVMPAFSLPLPRFSPEYRTAGR